MFCPLVLGDIGGDTAQGVGFAPVVQQGAFHGKIGSGLTKAQGRLFGLHGGPGNEGLLVHRTEDIGLLAGMSS